MSTSSRSNVRDRPVPARSATRLQRAVVPVVQASWDAVLAVGVVAAAVFVRASLGPGLFGFDPFVPVRDYITLWPALVLLLVGRAVAGLYPGYGLHPAEELKRQTVVAASVLAIVLAGGALFQFATVYSRFILVLAGGLVLTVLPVGRALLNGLLARSSLYGIRVWVVGQTPRAADLVAALANAPTLGLRVAGRSSGPPGDEVALRNCVVVPDAAGSMPLAELLDRLGERFERVWLVPNLLDVASVWVTPRDLQGHLALEVRNNLLKPRNRVLKRFADMAIVIASLPLTVPLVALVAAAVAASGPGGVLFRQERIGRGGATFRMLKFRSMHGDASERLAEHLAGDASVRDEWLRTRKLRHDPRVTRLGAFLRRTSLDELPQLFNVLRGEMSLVGPRPVMPDEIAWYGSSAMLYANVPPGLTGMTQVSGRSELSYDERVRLDAYYVRNWSIWLDLVLLGRTVVTVATRRGAF